VAQAAPRATPPRESVMWEEENTSEKKAASPDPAAGRGRAALRMAAAAALDDDDDDMDFKAPGAQLVPKTRKITTAEKVAAKEAEEAAAAIAAAVKKAVAEEQRKAEEVQRKALAAQAASAARLHKQKLSEALQAQHTLLYEQVQSGTLPPPRQATWTEAVSASVVELLPGAKSFFDIFGVAPPANQLAELVSEDPDAADRLKGLEGEAAAAVAAASAKWAKEKAAWVKEKAALEQRATSAEARAETAEAKAERSALSLMELRGQRTTSSRSRGGVVAGGLSSSGAEHAAGSGMGSGSHLTPRVAERGGSPSSGGSAGATTETLSSERPGAAGDGARDGVALGAALPVDDSFEYYNGGPNGPSSSSLADLLADMEETTKAAGRHLGRVSDMEGDRDPDNKLSLTGQKLLLEEQEAAKATANGEQAEAPAKYTAIKEPAEELKAISEGLSALGLDKDDRAKVEADVEEDMC